MSYSIGVLFGQVLFLILVGAMVVWGVRTVRMKEASSQRKVAGAGALGCGGLVFVSQVLFLVVTIYVQGIVRDAEAASPPAAGDPLPAFGEPFPKSGAPAPTSSSNAPSAGPAAKDADAKPAPGKRVYVVLPHVVPEAYSSFDRGLVNGMVDRGLERQLGARGHVVRFARDSRYAARVGPLLKTPCDLDCILAVGKELGGDRMLVFNLRQEGGNFVGHTELITPEGTAVGAVRVEDTTRNGVLLAFANPPPVLVELFDETPDAEPPVGDAPSAAVPSP